MDFQYVSMIVHPRFSFNDKSCIVVFSPFCTILPNKKITSIKNITINIILNTRSPIIRCFTRSPIAFSDWFPLTIKNVAYITYSSFFPILIHTLTDISL